MPHGWTSIDGTPSWLRDCWDDPGEFKRRVQHHVASSGAGLEHVYFAPDGERRALVIFSFGGTVTDAEPVRDSLQTDFEQPVHLVLSTVEKVDEQKGLSGT
jgi:hypothetical protein